MQQTVWQIFLYTMCNVKSSENINKQLIPLGSSKNLWRRWARVLPSPKSLKLKATSSHKRFKREEITKVLDITVGGNLLSCNISKKKKKKKMHQSALLGFFSNSNDLLNPVGCSSLFFFNWSYLSKLSSSFPLELHTARGNEAIRGIPSRETNVITCFHLLLQERCIP